MPTPEARRVAETNRRTLDEIMWSYESRPEMMDRYPMQRPGEESNIAKAVVYFMAADWVTGQVTDVNGDYFID